MDLAFQTWEDIFASFLQDGHQMGSEIRLLNKRLHDLSGHLMAGEMGWADMGLDDEIWYGILEFRPDESSTNMAVIFPTDRNSLDPNQRYEGVGISTRRRYIPRKHLEAIGLRQSDFCIGVYLVLLYIYLGDVEKTCLFPTMARKEHLLSLHSYRSQIIGSKVAWLICGYAGTLRDEATRVDDTRFPIEELLHLGCDVNFGWSVLCARQCCFESVNTFLSAGADPNSFQRLQTNISDEYRGFTIHYNTVFDIFKWCRMQRNSRASCFRYPYVVGFRPLHAALNLLDEDFEVFDPEFDFEFLSGSSDSESESDPLVDLAMVFFRKHQEPIIYLLLEKGADKTMKDGKGKTPADYDKSKFFRRLHD